MWRSALPLLRRDREGVGSVTEPRPNRAVTKGSGLSVPAPGPSVTECVPIFRSPLYLDDANRVRMMRTGAVFAIITVLVVATRLCHSHVLWADDNLPLAAAMEIARGKTLYRDVWFDKPALVAWIALLWGARAGALLRLAGAAYVLAVAA